jgi:hypothetical protein
MPVVLMTSTLQFLKQTESTQRLMFFRRLILDILNLAWILLDHTCDLGPPFLMPFYLLPHVLWSRPIDAWLSMIIAILFLADSITRT